MHVVVGIAVVLGLAHAAIAQPVTRPSRCEVTIVDAPGAHAPEVVREVIEEWVRAEPRCTTTLEVRVVPTDGGLYLLARDGSGRLQERLVPDAQSAGALVASWVADDSIEPPAPPPVAVNVNVDVQIDATPRDDAQVAVRATPIPHRAGWFVSGGPIFAGVAVGGEVAIGGYLEPHLKLAITGMAVSILPAGGDGAFAAGLKLTRVGNASRWRFDYGVQVSIISVRPNEISGWTSGGHVGLGWDLSRHVGLGVQLAAALAKVDGEYVPAGWASLMVERSL